MKPNQFRLSTCIAIMILAGLVVGANCLIYGRSFALRTDGEMITHFYGMPITALRRFVFDRKTPSGYVSDQAFFEFSPLYFLIDIAFWLLVLWAAARILEALHELRTKRDP